MRAAAALLLLLAPLAARADEAPPGPAVPDAPPAPAQLAPPPQSAPGTLRLEGNGLTRTADCTGRNVLIDGSDGRFTLTGGCRSVVVRGYRDAVQAAIMPGARLAVGGDGVTVRYRLIRPGAAPVVSVTGESRVLPADGAPP